MSMDYKEKYKAIVGWLKKYADEGMNITPSDIRISVPELAESEDERIIDGFRTLLDGISRKGGLTLNKVPLQKCYAYLEKQKEQKPLDIPSGGSGAQGTTPPSYKLDVKPSKQSDNERVKDAIRQCVFDMRGEVEKLYQVSYEDVLAYLENSKEAQPGDKDRYMEGYINGMNDTLKELKEQPKLMGAYEELKQPVWRKIKKGDYLPCRAYLWKLGFEDKKNFHGDCFVDGYLVPNEAVGVGCDTWYLPVDAIKNLPKEE